MGKIETREEALPTRSHCLRRLALTLDVTVLRECVVITLHCFETVSPGEKLAQRPMPQYDGLSDTLLPSIQAGVIDDGGSLKQVTLVSPNLYEA